VYTIESKDLRVNISATGAELLNITGKKTGKEYLWQGDPAWWDGRAPILFPILCSLKDGKYLFGDETFYMPKHGFVRQAKFNVAEQEASMIIFEFEDTEETFDMYPFSFVFQVIFEVVGTKLFTTYRVINKDEDDCMYFSAGAHEAFNIPLHQGESFEDYYLEFDNVSAYVREKVNAQGLMSGNTAVVIDHGNTLKLRPDLFNEDALIFRNIQSEAVSVKSTKSGTRIDYHFGGAPHLGIWQKPGAPYICIEPWFGLPDEANHDYKIENKTGIVKLAANDTWTWTHSISIYES